MQIQFNGAVIEWRGPAPFYFVAVPSDESADIEAVAADVTYGWGAIPASISIGVTTFRTSLFPKDGGYVVPLKAAVRSAEHINLGQTVTLQVTIDI